MRAEQPNTGNLGTTLSQKSGALPCNSARLGLLAHLEITTDAGPLTVKGRLAENDAESSRAFLHKGIATRAFERRFQLADHIRVVSASLVNGLLFVELLHEVPEAAKPRQIDIVAPTSAIELGNAA